MNPKILLTTLVVFHFTVSFAGDTLYFRLSNPWNTVKSPTGEYLRKCIQENNHYHCWDYNSANLLITESFYSDTNFTTKILCHKYYSETKGYLEQTRCYLNGRLNGYFVGYNEKGDTTFYQVYENGAPIKEWALEPSPIIDVAEIDEKPAEFPGGQSAWLAYLGKNIRRPKTLNAEGITGQILAKVVIDRTGHVKTVEIIKGLHPVFDEEVIIAIKKSPKWKPARQNGRNVSATFTQPISF